MVIECKCSYQLASKALYGVELVDSSMYGSIAFEFFESEFTTLRLNIRFKRHKKAHSSSVIQSISCSVTPSRVKLRRFRCQGSRSKSLGKSMEFKLPHQFQKHDTCSCIAHVFGETVSSTLHVCSRLGVSDLKRNTACLRLQLKHAPFQSGKTED